MKTSSPIDRIRKYLKKNTKEISQKPKNIYLVEKKLLTKLKVLAFILFGFSILFFIYAMMQNPLEDTFGDLKQVYQSENPSEISPHEILDFFAIAFVFLTLGALSLLTYKTKKKKNKP